jgi:MSHA biogenesis protein MshM
MYLEYFGLKQFPFDITPDTQFFCNLPTHREALNVLLLALQSGEGFIKITGPIGTGKTLLCRKLLNELQEPFITAYIPNPDLSVLALHQAIADELGIKYAKHGRQSRILSHINQYLLNLASQGKRVVLLIDETQAMPLITLESLRLLSNLETEKQKLLQIVLFAQPELDDILGKQIFRQLRQRISFSYKIQSLTSQQIRAYFYHRMAIAGNPRTDLLGSLALSSLTFFSKGIPRLVNILAHKALMVAYGKGQNILRWQHIYLAAVDTELTRRYVLLFQRTGYLVVGLVLSIYLLAWLDV